MGQSPFAKRPPLHDSGAGRRRSTRVEFVVPVILAGRDATGQSFREETETSTVNLHGAKLRTRYQVLVGMQVGIENPRYGMAEKAICVQVYESPPGQGAHDIAIQLLKAKNLWGLENPPADWQTVEEELGGQPPAPPRAPAVVKIPAHAAPPFASVAESSPGPAAQPSLELQFAEMERRSAELMESILQILRRQAAGIISGAVGELERQLKTLVAGAETQLTQRAEKAYADLESSVGGLRADLAVQLRARTEQIVDSAEEALRSRVADLFPDVLKPPPTVAPGKTAKPAPKK